MRGNPVDRLLSGLLLQAVVPGVHKPDRCPSCPPPAPQQFPYLPLDRNPGPKLLRGQLGAHSHSGSAQHAHGLNKMRRGLEESRWQVVTQDSRIHVKGRERRTWAGL